MTNKARKPYQKPQIRRVKLVAEEAVLAVCKISYGRPGSLTGMVCGESPCVEFPGGPWGT